MTVSEMIHYAQTRKQVIEDLLKDFQKARDFFDKKIFEEPNEDPAQHDYYLSQIELMDQGIETTREEIDFYTSFLETYIEKTSIH